MNRRIAIASRMRGGELTGKKANKAVKTLDLATMEQENSRLPDSLSGRVRKNSKVYSSIRPLITVVPTLTSSRPRGAELTIFSPSDRGGHLLAGDLPTYMRAILLIYGATQPEFPYPGVSGTKRVSR